MTLCPNCERLKKGTSDMLCLECWALVPPMTKRLWMLVWRMNQAKLIEDELVVEMNRIIVLTAKPMLVKELEKVILEKVILEKRREPRTDTLSTRLMKELPIEASHALSAKEVALLADVDIPAAQVWFSVNRGKHPQLRSVDKEGKSRFLYWKELQPVMYQ